MLNNIKKNPFPFPFHSKWIGDHQAWLHHRPDEQWERRLWWTLWELVRGRMSALPGRWLQQAHTIQGNPGTRSQSDADANDPYKSPADLSI